MVSVMGGLKTEVLVSQNRREGPKLQGPLYMHWYVYMSNEVSLLTLARLIQMLSEDVILLQ